ncbi:MAG: leucyl aminopeptidase family protein [Gammaproteobacteria bacterium]|nr:leucyl aminopeptidase family protein [Gammaproteobacteria bacterium]
MSTSQSSLTEKRGDGVIPVIPLTEADFPGWREGAPATARRFAESSGFSAKAETHCFIADEKGEITQVLAGVGDPGDPFCLARLPLTLPAGNYYLKTDWTPAVLERATIGWALGAYRFTRYKGTDQVMPKLVIDKQCDARSIKDQVNAVFMVRDLVNTPAEDMMPEHLQDVVRRLGQEFEAETMEVVGEALLEQNFPAIHAVGRASAHPPRLLDLRWGDASNPRLTLVGKGVCFDTGGLDLKSAANMRLMKKDMGGAAHAIGLARLVMCADLPVRLRLLVPAVDNAVSGNAFRPGDVLATRKGMTVEIDNTDAEGRLILCDALTEGGSESPDLMIDFATLTGAARVALGTDLPALFCNDDPVADALVSHGAAERDPLWRLPLYAPYRELIDSNIADITNSASRPYGGAITAALFLESFVPDDVRWAHIDLMAWNLKTRPGRPEGGEAMGLRSVYACLRERYR